MALKSGATPCPYCGTECSFNLAVQDGRAAGTEPYRYSPVDEEKVHPKGTYVHDSPTDIPLALSSHGIRAEGDTMFEPTLGRTAYAN